LKICTAVAMVCFVPPTRRTIRSAL
jgi:hypothetical protein